MPVDEQGREITWGQWKQLVMAEMENQHPRGLVDFRRSGTVRVYKKGRRVYNHNTAERDGGAVTESP